MNSRLVVVAGLHLGGEKAADTLPGYSRAAIIDALMRDTLAMAEQVEAGPGWPAPQYVLLYPDRKPWYESRATQYWLLLPQMGQGTSQCLDNALIMLAPEPTTVTLFLGPTTPHLDPRLLHSAYAALSQHDVVLGPFEEGGVYLLGVRGRWPAGILREVRWDTKMALPDLRKAFKRSRMACALMPPTYGLHDETGLQRLSQQLMEYPETALHHLRDLLST